MEEKLENNKRIWNNRTSREFIWSGLIHCDFYGRSHISNYPLFYYISINARTSEEAKPCEYRESETYETLSHSLEKFSMGGSRGRHTNAWGSL